MIRIRFVTKLLPYRWGGELRLLMWTELGVVKQRVWLVVLAFLYLPYGAYAIYPVTLRFYGQRIFLI